MQLIATGDLHVYPYAEFSRSLDPDGMTPLGRRILDTAKWLRSLCSTTPKGTPTLLLNGDLTTTPGGLDSASMHLLSTVEKTLLGTRRVYNLGNHDQGSKGGGIHNLELLVDDGYLFVAKPGEVCTTSDGLYCVPYTHSLDEQRALLEQVPDRAVVAIHYPILGVLMTPSVMENVGLDPLELRRFGLVLSSHYHLPQIWEPGRAPSVVSSEVFGKVVSPGTIISLGTPLAHSFGDTNPIYGCWQLDGHALTFRGNPHSPRYVTLTDSEVLPPVPAAGVYLSVDNEDDYDKFTAMSEDTGSGVLGVRLRSKRSSGVVDRLPSISAQDNTLGSTVSTYLDHTGLPGDTPKEKLLDYICGLESSVKHSPGMSSVSFESLDVSGFLSWESASLVFSEYLGLWLVQGMNHDTESADSNGSGKSGLFEALAWAVFDRTIRGVGKDDVISSKSSSGAKVSVVLSTPTGKYRVTRFRKVRGLGTGVEFVSLHPDGTLQADLSKTSALDTNKLILDTLGLTWDMFCLTCLLGQGFSSRFSSLSDADKKSLLESVLNLSAYDQLKDLAVASLRELQAQESSKLAKKVALEGVRDNLTASVESEVSRISKQRKEDEEKLTALRESLHSRLSDETDLTFRRGVLQDYLAQDQAALVALKGRYNEKFLLALKAKGEVQKLLSKMSTDRERMATVKSSLSSLASRLSSEGGSCSVCGSPLSEEAVRKLRESITSKMAPLQAELPRLVESVSLLSSQLEITSSVADELTPEEAEKHRKEVSDVEASIATYKSHLASLDVENATRLATVAAIESSISEIESRDYSAALVSLRESLSSVTLSLDQLSSELDSLDERKRVSSDAVRVLDPKGVRSYLLDQGVSELNSHLVRYSSELFGSDCLVQLSSVTAKKDGDTSNAISLVITTQGGSYVSASGGERRKADLALHLALRDFVLSRGGGCNVLVADEVLDTLDSTSSRRVLSVLGTVPGSVFLISHSGSVSPFVQNVIRVVKRAGVSSLEAQMINY